MRFCLVILALLVVPGAQNQHEKQLQSGACPKTAELGVSPSQKFWFEGELGKKNVRVYVERGGDGVVGAFYDTTEWDPLTLGGRWKGEKRGAVELTAFTEDDKEAGFLKARLTKDGLEGTWSARKEEEGVAFHLKSVAQPKCDGSEAWKVFDDKRWPIRFSYPSTWHVSVGAKSVALACPDPSLMVYDAYEINVRQGVEANEATSDFIQCGEKWIYGYECTCGDTGRCKGADATEHGGMTVLEGDQKVWRVYCRGGGYAGKGSGERRILTFGDTWIVVEGQGEVAGVVEKVAGSAGKKSN